MSIPVLKHIMHENEYTTHMIKVFYHEKGSVAEQADWSHTWSQTSNIGFLVVRAIYYSVKSPVVSLDDQKNATSICIF